ncbi:MAG: adenylyl-sulfate kinase [Flavobacteriaceae bacterium]|nr:adenylyl-sulfate kinase [Flavobacteriaceae bacterium]
MQENIIPHNFNLRQEERSNLKKHRPLLLWFTGLSGSGKSTIANLVEVELHKKGIHTYLLDGDNVRKGLNNNLTFSPEDRTENIRRIAEVSNLMIDAGLVVLAAFVSPYKKDREMIKNTVKSINFVEIFVDTSVEECERRDTKGLYAKARKGLIKDFTGINAPYEAPENPDVLIETENTSVEEAVNKVTEYVERRLK